MGVAIGMCPKNKLFRAYIEMELKLFEFTRCRTLYEKWIEWDSGNCTAWIKFAELERGLEDYERVRAIYELAVVQPNLDMPELLWKAYIDFEEEEAEYERTRALYERLLEKTDHVKVWTSYAHFEINVPDNDVEVADDEEVPISDAAKARARAVFQRAHKLYKSRDLTFERVALLNAWKSFEDAHGSDEDKEAIAKQMPRKVKKRRRLDDDSFEEYMDYVFPADDAGAAKMSKLMAQAQAWKRQQEANAAAS
jgi:crooked neck